MRLFVTIVPALALIALGVGTSGVAAEQGGAGHNHIGHVADAFNGTPEGQGLLPTALAEARIAAQHAGLAAGDTSNLEAMKSHTGHVLNAVDPTVMENGPGLGYGVKRAAEGAAKHIQAAAGSEGASQAITTHATHVATSAQNTVARADEIVMLAQKIQGASRPRPRRRWCNSSTRCRSNWSTGPMPMVTGELAGKKVKGVWLRPSSISD